jgi:mono/diheme cytochrome c family protein
MSGRKARFSPIVLGVLISVLGVFPSDSLTQVVSVPGDPASSARVDFLKQVQPIFRASCHRCHGPDMQMGRLRLDSKALALEGGLSGKAIIPGKPAESLLLQRVLGQGDRVRMPMDGPPLASEQIALLRGWIEEGASWPEEASVVHATIDRHWAYVKPVKHTLPLVRQILWTHNPIDHFVLARLEKEGLSPSAEASRESLIRRVSLDLTGLPPSVAEVEAFAADPDPDAYTHLVDRLLASPHYGERWARFWLDLARYADTNGYEKDLRRTMWPYRDWVINAFNEDKPFDQFTIEQIAGDLLPGATLEQRIATGFHRNTMLNEEGGVDQEEARWTSIIDRVGTTASVWLGSTLACAQCHNHKYDPFTQKEFYQLFAFFENAEYRIEGEYGYRKLIEPVLDLPTPEQEQQRRTLREEISKLDAALKTTTPELEAAQAQWERQEAPNQAKWSLLDPEKFSSANAAGFTKLADKSLRVQPSSERDTCTIVARTSLEGITGFQLELLGDDALPAKPPVHSKEGKFILTSFKVQAAPQGDDQKKSILNLHNVRADVSQDAFPIANAIDGNLERGWAVSLQAGQAHWALFETAIPAGGKGGTILTFTLDYQSLSDQKKLVGRLRLSASKDRNATPAQPLPERLRSILDTPTGQRTEEQKKELSAYYLSIASSLEPTRKKLAELNRELAQMPIPTTLVMKEQLSAERPFTYLRVRGSYLNKGEKVYAGVPAALHPLPESQMTNRLGLAHWLVDENNPLVARVIMNRFWEQLFGRGIVETSEDFGLKGERPSHPELLDWLATEFVERRWSMKSMLRLIVTSATYRQSSQVNPTLLDRDPNNKLLARGPRFRMEAEMIRDATLAASGLLSQRIGGPSVFPFQPEGVWSVPYSNEQWVTSEGPDRYRRGLYTFWRRSAPYPSFLTFDATSREFCTLKRIRTNTPLQALTTLNDPAFFEAAKGLAKRVLAEAPQPDQARLSFGFRLCAARKPEAAEVNRLIAFYQLQLEHFRRDQKATQDITKGCLDLALPVDGPEFAAWTMVSNVLLNMDQMLNKE